MSGFLNIFLIHVSIFFFLWFHITEHLFMLTVPPEFPLWLLGLLTSVAHRDRATHGVPCTVGTIQVKEAAFSTFWAGSCSLPDTLESVTTLTGYVEGGSPLSLLSLDSHLQWGKKWLVLSNSPGPFGDTWPSIHLPFLFVCVCVCVVSDLDILSFKVSKILSLTNWDSFSFLQYKSDRMVLTNETVAMST